MGVVKKLARLARPVVERFPIVPMVYRFVRDNRRVLDVPKMIPLGFRLIGNPAMESGRFEIVETEIFNRILDKVDVVVNIGANIGYYCCIALQRGKHVVAFEPIATNLRYLCKNVKANGWEDQIEVFPLALSGKHGIIEIYGGGTAASLVKGWAGIPEQYVELVPVSSLDAVLGFRFDGRNCFFLVDIEGAEKMMLEGANIALSWSPRPIWLVEISIAEHQPHGIAINQELISTFQIFWDRGYEAWTVEKRPRLVLLEEIERIVATGKDTLLTHNFLFVEKGRKSHFLGD